MTFGIGTNHLIVGITYQKIPSMSRQLLHPLLLAFLLFFIAPALSEAQSPPNIVIIMADDQGWGDLSLHGNPNIRTPNIDALADNGLQFNHFYVDPVCSPTRAAMLTGRYAVRGGVYATSAGGERLDLDEKTLPEYFKAAGYATSAFGKWHNGMQPPYHPNSRGFDEFYGFCSGHWGSYFSPMLEHNGKLIRGSGYLPDDLTDQAMAFIEQHREEPFLVYLPFPTPHTPMQVPDDWWEKAKDRPLRARHRAPEKEDTTFTRAALAMVENIDWNVGRLTARLRQLGLEDNTIIAYLSDNGPNSWRWNGDMKGRKAKTDEGGVRSPLLIQWKGQLEAGKVVKPIASVHDLLPTLADLAGVNLDPPKPLDGQSLKPLLLGKVEDWPERLIINQWGDRISVRSQQFRLSHDGQLFDMEADPGQRKDVAQEHPEILLTLKAEQERFRQEVLSELVTDEKRAFHVGHPDHTFTQLPARDAIATGDIKRSNRWPNCSYYSNWTRTTDSIYWEVDVLKPGPYQATLYYTCAPENTGAAFRLSGGDQAVGFKITQAHDPPLRGARYDRTPRDVSFVKDWKTMELPVLNLESGRQRLALSASNISGSQAIDFRLLQLERQPLNPPYSFEAKRNPIIQHLYTADPAARTFGDTLYLYTSHDQDTATGFSMENWRVFSTPDLVHWTDHGAPFGLDDLTWADEYAWAPDAINRNGKYYFYYPVEQQHIGVAVADSPYGPFRDPLGHPLISHNTPGVVSNRDFIDPAVFIDDNGQAYLLMGQLKVNIVKLNEDMISYDGEVIILDKAQTPGFFEAIWLHKHDSKYYLSYSGKNKEGQDIIRYAMADTVLGPYEYKGNILPPVNSGTNHHSIEQFKGEWYLFYHNSDLYFEQHPEAPRKFGWGHEGAIHPFRRSVCFSKLMYNPDGTIQPVNIEQPKGSTD